MSGTIDAVSGLEQRLPQQLDLSQRSSWNPRLSGDIDILIDRAGHWFHNGDPFTRDKIVRLFCQLLRAESSDDGLAYFLVTPVEKWRIRVAAVPLLITSFVVQGGRLTLRCNDDSEFELSRAHRLGSVSDAQGPLPVVEVRDQLRALIPRHLYYRLAELADWDGEQAWLGQGADRQLLPSLE